MKTNPDPTNLVTKLPCFDHIKSILDKQEPLRLRELREKILSKVLEDFSNDLLGYGWSYKTTANCIHPSSLDAFVKGLQEELSQRNLYYLDLSLEDYTITVSFDSNSDFYG